MRKSQVIVVYFCIWIFFAKFRIFLCIVATFLNIGCTVEANTTVEALLCFGPKAWTCSACNSAHMWTLRWTLVITGLKLETSCLHYVSAAQPRLSTIGLKTQSKHRRSTFITMNPSKHLHMFIVCGDTAASVWAICGAACCQTRSMLSHFKDRLCGRTSVI